MVLHKIQDVCSAPLRHPHSHGSCAENLINLKFFWCSNEINFQSHTSFVNAPIVTRPRLLGSQAWTKTNLKQIALLPSPNAIKVLVSCKTKLILLIFTLTSFFVSFIIRRMKLNTYINHPLNLFLFKRCRRHQQYQSEKKKNEIKINLF